MEQISLFEEEKASSLLSTHENVLKLHKQYIDEGEKDKDAFTWKETKSGYSYFFYGTKVMQLTASKTGKVKFLMKQPDGDFIALPPDDRSANDFVQLKMMKRKIFRELMPETFGCCNDFIRCSDALKCLHQDNRMYNGCLYRQNLEAGRIFYGKNKNI